MRSARPGNEIGPNLRHRLAINHLAELGDHVGAEVVERAIEARLERHDVEEHLNIVAARRRAGEERQCAS